MLIQEFPFPAVVHYSVVVPYIYDDRRTTRRRHVISHGRPMAPRSHITTGDRLGTNAGGLCEVWCHLKTWVVIYNRKASIEISYIFALIGTFIVCVDGHEMRFPASLIFIPLSNIGMSERICWLAVTGMVGPCMKSFGFAPRWW